MRFLVFFDDSDESHALKSRLSKLFSEHADCFDTIRETDVDAISFYKISVLPTIVCIDKSGAPIWRIEWMNESFDYERIITKQIKHKDDLDQFPQKHRGYERFAH